MKILLVEDSATLRHAMSSYIRAFGHDPLIASSGEEALQIVDKTPVDMIVMDVEMPGLDGFETTRLIREWLGDHWIPIIFVTGKSEDEDLEHGINAGGDDYLIKPVSQVILKAKIQAMERITNMRDQLNQLNQDLKNLSQIDGLTQLYNRRTFEEKAHEHWRLATRSKDPLAILLLDIDHFKLFNDYYGHPAGDECIKLVSSALQKCLNRPSDLVARYGGEEFIVMLPNTPQDGAYHVAEHIRKTVEKLNLKHRASTSSDRVTVSIGGSVVNFTTGSSLQQQISLADKALYESKQCGRNRSTVKLYNPHNTVLVVDDDEISIDIITETLRGHSTVVSTRSGEECLNMAKELKPDVIILDVYLPGVNGYAVCQSLRDDPSTAMIPVILISVCDREELTRFGKKVKANACLQKPLEHHRLIAKVNQFIT